MKAVLCTFSILFLVGCNREMCDSYRANQGKEFRREMHASDLSLADRDLIRQGCRIFEYNSDIRGRDACLEEATQRAIAGRTVYEGRGESPPSQCDLPWNR